MPVPSPVAVIDRPLRRDAEANRVRLLDAATRVFAQHGLDAGVEEIARTAGVGIGTMYRRFPTKQALIDALVGDLRLELLALAQEAAAAPAGTGLEVLLLRAGELQASHRGCLSQLWDHSDAELAAMAKFRAAIAQLLGQAQAAGRVRTDVVNTDVWTVLWSLRGVIETTRSVAPQAWRRHLEILVAGLRPPAEQFDAGLRERALSEARARRVAGAGSVRAAR